MDFLYQITNKGSGPELDIAELGPNKFDYLKRKLKM